MFIPTPLGVLKIEEASNCQGVQIKLLPANGKKETFVAAVTFNGEDIVTEGYSRDFEEPIETIKHNIYWNHLNAYEDSVVIQPSIGVYEFVCIDEKEKSCVVRKTVNLSEFFEEKRGVLEQCLKINQCDDMDDAYQKFGPSAMQIVATWLQNYVDEEIIYEGTLNECEEYIHNYAEVRL